MHPTVIALWGAKPTTAAVAAAAAVQVARARGPPLTSV
jgi:hypothetical protein